MPRAPAHRTWKGHSLYGHLNIPKDTRHAFGGKKQFGFDQIECVCMSPANLLSFQVGNQVWSLPVNPQKRRHQEAVSALLSGLAGTVPVS